MTHRAMIVLPGLLFSIVLAIGGCEQPVAVDDAPPPEGMTRQVSTQSTPGAPDVRGIMWTKLAHAHSILEAMVIGDLGAVERDAEALIEISSHATWLAHDTMTYHVFSDQFRDACSALADHARRGMLDAVTFDFNEMTSSCVACHKYVREERGEKDLPGGVSWDRPPARSDTTLVQETP